MNEAKKLPDHDQAPYSSGPRSSGPEVFAVEAQAAGPVPVTDETLALSAQSATLLVTPLRSKIAPPSSFGRKLATHMLIFTLIGLATFGLGAAAAWGLVTGALDGHTAQLKDWMHQAKDLMHQWTGH